MRRAARPQGFRGGAREGPEAAARPAVGECRGRMSGIAVAADWSQPDAGVESVRRMVAAMPHRAPDGVRVAGATHCAFGFALRATTARERAAAQPLHDPDSGLWVVADARIDNREEVARWLGLAAPPASDAELVLRGLATMGAAFASRLEGDFAFAAWDERRRVLLAARDAMGLRPLFWRASGGGLLLASEVDALLATGGQAEVEPAAVLDFLSHRAGPAARTFFRGIRRLPPGHVLEADRAGARDLGHARPPPLRPAPPSPGDEVPGFRRLLWRAVSDRLESEGPVVLALSGGLDSGAIACVAEALHREHPSRLAPLLLASAIFRGFPADDSQYLEAVLARVRFRCERWDASTAELATLDPFPRSHPVRDPMAGGVMRALEVARAAGSRVLLMGLGGDDLLYEGGVLEDLARRGRLLALVRETLLGRPYTVTPGPRLLSEALRSAAPSWARRAFRAVRPRLAAPPPRWLGPALRPLWPPPDSRRPDPIPSRVQADVRELFTSADLLFALEVTELAAARAGLQLRLPFLDRPLAEWVHSIPWQRRRPRGLMKRLLRDAMAGTWPEALARRRTATLANEYFSWSVSRALPLLAPMVEGLRWEAAPYVHHEEARRMLASMLGGRGGAEWRESMRLWDTGCLEWWLRQLRT